MNERHQLKEVHGDLIKMALEGEFDAIAHGCNCFCNMGADRQTARGSKAKLGLCSIAQQNEVWVINAYTQFDFGGRKRNVSYPAIRKCMRSLIGCGLAGGDWDRVKGIIQEELKDEDVTIVHFSKKYLP